MKTPRRWLETHPTSPEARLLREVSGEALPTGALSRAAKRFGVTAAIVNAASTGLAQQAVAQVASAATVSKVTGSVAFWGTLGKATAVGLCIGALGVGAAQQMGSRSSRTEEKSPAPALTASATKAVERSPAAIANSPPESPRSSRAIEDTADSPRARPLAVERDERAKRQGGVTSQAGPLPMPEPSPAARARWSDMPEERLDEPDLSQSSSTAERGQLPAAADSPPSSTEGPGSVLAREVRALDAVRDALARSDGPGALSILNHAEQRGSFQRLGREAAVLRVEALGAAGRLDDAQRLARALLQQGVSPTQQRVLERWVSSTRK